MTWFAVRRPVDSALTTSTYVAAIMVEDFANKSSMAPMSSVPLQMWEFVRLLLPPRAMLSFSIILSYVQVDLYLSASHRIVCHHTGYHRRSSQSSMYRYGKQISLALCEDYYYYGSFLGVPINVTRVERVVGTVYCSGDYITEFLTITPLYVNKTDITPVAGTTNQWYITLTWTPRDEQKGPQVSSQVVSLFSGSEVYSH